MHRNDIDGLRAYAVLPVLLFHLGAYRFSGGFVGVDVFFVISGFLITKLILDQLGAGEFSFGRFYGRRIRRLFPALFATIAFSTIFAFLLFSANHLKAFGGSAVYSILPVSNIWFWSEAGYWDGSKYAKPLLHTWSLSVEEQFYLIWPLLIVVFFTFARKWMLPAILVLSAASLVAAERLLTGHPETVFYWMPFRIVEFGTGAALLWLPAPHNRVLLVPLLMAGLALIAYSVLTFTGETRFPGAAAMIPCIGAALAIYAGQAPIAGRLLDNPIAVWIGRISYSLYLVHWPVIIFWRYYVFHAPTFGEKLGLLAVSFLLAAIMYVTVEQPFRRGKRITLRQFALVSACLAAVIITVGTSMSVGGGWAWRIPSEERTIGTADYGGKDCPYPYCFLPGGPGKEFVVTGDSYGRMYYAGLADFSDRKIPFSVFHFDAKCRFFNSENFDDQGYVCDTRLKDYLEYIRKKNIETLVVAHRWTNVGPQLLATDIPPGDTLEAISGRFAADRLEEFLSRPELKSVHNVVFVLNAPEQKLLTCEPTPKYVMTRDCSEVAISDFASIRNLNAQIKQAVIAKNLQVGITFVDPFDQVCNEYFCFLEIDRRSLFSDQYHLSEFGSRYVVERWPAAALDVLKNGTRTAEQ